jgi:hypothetical protein
MIKKLIKYLTPKKTESMAKQHETPENKDNHKDVKNLINALQKSNEDLKIVQKQFSFDNEHFVSVTIKANNKLLDSLK